MPSRTATAFALALLATTACHREIVLDHTKVEGMIATKLKESDVADVTVTCPATPFKKDTHFTCLVHAAALIGTVDGVMLDDTGGIRWELVDLVSGDVKAASQRDRDA